MNNGLKIAFAIVGATAFLFVLVILASSNSLIRKAEDVTGKWAQVEVMYQRRHDLIPQLVSTVRAAAAHERDTFREVTEARAQASRVQIDAAQLSDPAALQRVATAQDQLTVALQRLTVLSERYPELRTNENFLRLQDQLEGTENRISVARRNYNLAVQELNTSIRTFPGVIANSLVLQLEPGAPYRSQQGADQASTLTF